MTEDDESDDVGSVITDGGVELRRATGVNSAVTSIDDEFGGEIYGDLYHLRIIGRRR